MTIMEAINEKFEGLTAEQKEKLDSVQDAEGFKAFATETGITLTAEETAFVTDMFETGKLPLSDDDLDDATGGVSSLSVWLQRYRITSL